MVPLQAAGKVLIIGAGLGGLSLAQILRRYNVPFEIFERDETVSSRKQGWAVALVEYLPALEELLPSCVAEGLLTNSVNYHTDDHDELAFVNAETGEKVGAVGGVAHGDPGFILRRFTHYEQDEEGVTAFFDDGSSARGSLLVGADGAHSKVLGQLVGLANHEITLSQYVPILGEVGLPKNLYDPIRALGKAAILAAAPRVRLQIGMLSMNEDQSIAHIFWAIVLRRDKPQELSDWVVNEASKTEIYDFALAPAQHLHPVITDVIRFGSPNAIAQPQPRFLEAVPPETMPNGRVTVLGDAAHSMVPLRGAGANTAILDACDLARLLVRSREASDGSADPTGLLDRYHQLMIPRGRENVLSSRAAGEDDQDPAGAWKKMFQRAGQAWSGRSVLANRWMRTTKP